MLHRGVVSSIVETLASVGAGAWGAHLEPDVGVSNETSVFRDAHLGDVVTAIAEPVHRAADRQAWTVTVDVAGSALATGSVQLVHTARSRAPTASEGSSPSGTGCGAQGRLGARLAYDGSTLAQTRDVLQTQSDTHTRCRTFTLTA